MDRPSREPLLKEQWEKPSDILESKYDYSLKSRSSYRGYHADESNEFESISLVDNVERRQRRVTEPTCTAVGLVFLLQHYDRREVPDLAWGLQLDTVIIALVTVVRVALGAIVESGISQGAWMWVSEASQKRSNHHARLDDFKLFDEASRGLWGSIRLIWRMKFRHMACIGAAIVILVHGFETFSQQMVIFEERPRPADDATRNPAPAPPRSEVGIIATELPTLTPACYTANCSWPVIPTLAACGECGSLSVSSTCNETTQMCTYSTPSGTSLELPANPGDQGFSKVAPSNGTKHPMSSADRAYFSVFDILTVTSTGAIINTTANECALWFCLHAYDLSVSQGQSNSSLLGNWSTTKFEYGSSTHGTQYRFLNIPASFNINNSTTYAVTQDAITVLRDFMASLTSGTVTINANVLDYSSDWIEAMWNATSDLDSWMATFTLAMTNEIRQQGTVNPRGGNYNGYAMQMAPFISVQWLWLIYPGVLIAGSLYFLFYTIARGAHDGVSVWKSDALPMLFCKIDTGIHDQVRDGMDVPNGLEERVGHTKVALYRGERGEWTFRTVKDGEESDGWFDG
ncbi:hypothetical protein CONLIGDRAFT_717714 [Coniochaeta ligniaria NRRL 30616]|uniref:Uncharacterized protein n=1 Tax=Coniochaeta ligniaria NRRL 30616 TaxID=1408157 RepID=A0A1J7IYB9_9PEZI|nr:hypothetical protein CONLIGDRAFT_717714 [Coniochaeta ligniaria NRRL 30616]